MKKVLQLSGLDCAACATELEEEISKIEGVSVACVTFVNQKLTVEYATESVLEKVVYVANHFEEVKVLETENGVGRYVTNGESHKKEWLMIAISALLFIGGILFEQLIEGTASVVGGYVCYGAAYFIVGYPVLLATVKNLLKRKIFDENFLMTVASLGAVCIGEVGEGVAVMLLYQIGEVLQSLAVASSRRSVSKLMDLKSEHATLLIPQKSCDCGCCHGHTRKMQQRRVTPEEINVGDILLVKVGEKIPVDGILLGETASLDTKSLTGESSLRVLKKGEELLSGCVNVGGVFEMRATRKYEDSAVSRILDMVENAASGKATPEKFITKFAKIYTPVVCILALAVAVFAPLANGLIVENRLYFKDYARWLQSALTFLVVSCPCALVISVPLTYFLGIGACATRGVLVKGATYLDVLAKAQTVALDKTGTLTEGNFTVCDAYPEENITKKELLALATAVEKNSAHPIAKAFETYETEYIAENVREKAGRGLIADVQGEYVLVGNAELLRENGVEYQTRESAHTLVYVAKDGACLGAIEIGDKLRDEAKRAVLRLKSLGISRIVMLTGDNEKRARKIANEVGVYEVNAQLLPDEKLQRAQELKKSGALIYVGDGINDTPVMAVADCAVSMGKLGSATAIEASDLVLVSDDLTALPRGVKIARKTRKIVMQNIVFSIVMKASFMVLGALGILPLALAVFADVGVMLVAVLNSFRVKVKNK